MIFLYNVYKKIQPYYLFTMSTQGKESRSSTLSDVILAFEEEMSRELVSTSVSKTDSDSDTDSVESFEENFPPLNTDVKKTWSVPKTKKLVGGKNEEFDTANTKSMKAYVCNSVEEGIICPYGKKCKFAHNASELETKKCIYGDDCNRIKIRKGTVANVDEKNPCIFIHPSETIGTFVDRRKIIGLPLEDVKDPCVYRYTRMCVSYINGIECQKGKECTYAHTVQELRATKCNFGENCHNVLKNSNLYVNKGEKVCVFLHPHETLDNFYNRALKKKNDKILEKIEIVESEDKVCDSIVIVSDKNILAIEESTVANIDNEDALNNNKDANESADEIPDKNEDIFDNSEDTNESMEETSDINEDENENLSSDYDEEYKDEKINMCEEACIIISLPRNEIGKLCELILSSDIKARITKQ